MRQHSPHGIAERADLQRLLRSQIDVIAPDTLIVAEEFCDWEDSRRRIDLIGNDRDANLVVIELKPDMQAFENVMDQTSIGLARLARID